MTYGEIETTVKEILAKQLSMEPQKDRSGIAFGRRFGSRFFWVRGSGF